MFHAPTDDSLTSGFNYTATNEVALIPEVTIACAVHVCFKVVDLTLNSLDGGFGESNPMLRQETLGGGDEGSGTAAFHDFAPVFLFALCFLAVVAPKGGGDYPEMFTGVIEVEDLHGIREVQAGVLPDPESTVAEVDGLGDASVSATQSFLTKEGARIPAAGKGANITRRLVLTYRLAVFIGCDLSEDATEFGLSCAGSSIGLFAFDALKFVAAKGHAGAVAGDVEDGRRPLLRVGTLWREAGESGLKGGC